MLLPTEAPLSRQQSIITTYHEAGHAVMAMANGFTVTRVSNVSNDDSLGHVSWQRPDFPTNSTRIGTVLVLASGMAADFIHWKQNGQSTEELCMGHESDRQQAKIHLEELNENDKFDVYLAVSISFLRRQDVWVWVEDFAQLMMLAGTIDGRELLYNASRNVPKFGASELELLKRAKLAHDNGIF